MAIKSQSKFNPEKALETILYVARQTPKPSTYWVLKIIYFADKMHLARYGRQISGDDYYALRNGPVPSQSYDMVKDVRDGRISLFSSHAMSSFEVNRVTNNITVLRPLQLDLFSRSDLQCIDQSIAENGMLEFLDLKHKSHDAAFLASNENDEIPLSEIIAMLPNSDLLRDYLNCA